MQILEYSLHRVDVNEDEAKRLKLSSSEGVKEYAKKILDDAIGENASRSFKFKDTNELVASVSHRIIDNLIDWEEASSTLANKLHRVETQVQEGIGKMGREVTKGALLLLKISDDNEKILIVTKIDDSEFLDEEDGEIKSGLPLKTRVQKCAVLYFDEEGSLSELLLSDSRTTITPYWYEKYLEAEPLKDSETNTLNAFNSIDALLDKEVRRKGFKEDYWLLRNELVIYFKNEEGFDFDELTGRFDKHTSNSKEGDEALKSFKTKLKKLPENPKKGFDTKFDLETKNVKLRIKKTLFSDKNFKVDILKDIEDIRNKIGYGEDDQGKYIRLYSDDAYASITNKKH